MKLTSPTQLRKVLDELSIRPARKLGQNFLTDANILRILLQAANVSAQDVVLEIGPGLGTVTEQLLAQAGRLIAVEKDGRLVEFLKKRFAGEERLELIHADVLDLHLAAVLGSGVTKVVSNLPYASGSRIIMEIVRAPTPPAEMVITVQEEVAARLAAQPGDSERGLLSVGVQMVYDVTMIKKVSPQCFWPKPEVTSAIMRMARQGRVLSSLEERRGVHVLARLAFGQRRKQIAAILAHARVAADSSEAKCLLERAGIAPSRRPEELTLDEWRQLWQLVKKTRLGISGENRRRDGCGLASKSTV